jgi:hypothetical protein
MENRSFWTGVAVLTVVACFFAGYSYDGAPQAQAAPEDRTSSGFNLDSAAGDRAAVPARAPVSSLTPPPSAKTPAAAPAASPRESLEAWVLRQGLYAALMAAPVDFIVKKTLLATGDGFARFCKDPSRVDRYLRHPIIRGVIDSPALLRAVLSTPAVAEGVLRSPAMQDPRAVAAFADSALMKRIANDPGIQRVLSEPGVVNGLVANPQTLGFLMSHPTAMSAFARISPMASAALGRR